MDSRALRVLLVEDSPRIAAMLRDLLESDGGVRVVEVVSDEQSAIRQAQLADIDVMILDLQLAKGTGFGVLSQLRDKRPVTVVLTNYALPEYRRRALALGVEYFLDKSKDLEKLQSIMTDLREQVGNG
jgi:CheY-like chemotaxis protein